MTRFLLDRSTTRPGDGDVVIGGSPLRLFRLTAAGRRQFERLEAGGDVPRSVLTDRLQDAGAIHPHPHLQGGRFSAADVTVVVPALNAPPDRLAELVAGCTGVAAVIVVDDGSQPPLAVPAGARGLRLHHNAGPAVARNVGLAATTTPLVAFVDTDVELAGDWLAPLLGHFDDERVGLVAPRVAGAPGASRLARYEERHGPLDLGAEPARIAPGSRVSYVPGAALLARTEVLRAMGGFDRTLRLGEDVDAVWRLVQRGWRARYEPEAVVHHRPRATWRAAAAQRVDYGSSAAPLAQRHAGALAPARFGPWTAAVWALLLAGYAVPAVALAGGTAAAFTRKLRGVPARDAMRLALLGHALAGRQLADAARRAWWPALLAGSLVSRRVRRWSVLALLPALADGGALRVADDVAYGLGVWNGVLRSGDVGPLIPDVGLRHRPALPHLGGDRPT